MANDVFRAGTTAELSELGHLDRCEAVPQLVGDPNDFLGSIRQFLRFP